MPINTNNTSLPRHAATVGTVCGEGGVRHAVSHDAEYHYHDNSADTAYATIHTIRFDCRRLRSAARHYYRHTPYVITTDYCRWQ